MLSTAGTAFLILLVVVAVTCAAMAIGSLLVRRAAARAESRNLDLLAERMGYLRKRGESDAAFRARIRAAMSASAGSAADIGAVLAGIEGVRDFKIVDAPGQLVVEIHGDRRAVEQARVMIAPRVAAGVALTVTRRIA